MEWCRHQATTLPELFWQEQELLTGDADKRPAVQTMEDHIQQTFIPLLLQF